MSVDESILGEIKNSIVDMEDQRVVDLTRKALEGFSAEEILNRALIKAMEEVGSQYEEGKKFIPEMLLSAEAMTAALKVLRPILAQTGAPKAGSVVMGTVQGDVHDIGQKMVCIMLEGAGFEVWSLGADVPPSEFVKAVKTKRPHLLGISALLTTTAPRMKQVIAALEQEGLRDKVKIMVGGAVLNQKLASDFGADGYAPDAAAAVRLAKSLMAGGAATANT
jgi:5-methyltetrahydrofolate--homocysteine methyltransferase